MDLKWKWLDRCYGKRSTRYQAYSSFFINLSYLSRLQVRQLVKIIISYPGWKCNSFKIWKFFHNICDLFFTYLFSFKPRINVNYFYSLHLFIFARSILNFARFLQHMSWINTDYRVLVHLFCRKSSKTE